MPEFCLLLPPNPARPTSEVDKNGAKSLNFVYAATPKTPQLNLSEFSLAANSPNPNQKGQDSRQAENLLPINQ
jgi:hypothetical protein